MASTSRAPYILALATHNHKKRQELQAVLDPTGQALALVSPEAMGVAEPDEPFHSFLENALHKARAAAAALAMPALADDSGLCVQALHGAPGVHSAHYAGALDRRPKEDREGLRGRQDAANNALLLDRTAPLRAGVAEGRLIAAFVCTLVAVRHAEDPEPIVAQGRWTLELLAAPQGEGGFGYDPLMWVPSHGCTVAELPSAEKNRLSHRARAAERLKEELGQAWGWSWGTGR